MRLFTNTITSHSLSFHESCLIRKSLWAVEWNFALDRIQFETVKYQQELLHYMSFLQKIINNLDSGLFVMLFRMFFAIYLLTRR